MKPKLIRCSNPNCRRPFLPDDDHAYGSACCAICSRVYVAPPPKRYHEPISGRPAVVRRHSKENRQ